MARGAVSGKAEAAGWKLIHTYLRSQIGAKAAEPTKSQTTGGKHSATSNHFKGLAIDYGDANSDCKAVVAALEPFARTGLLSELYFAPTNTWFKNGRKLTQADIGGHQDHVHVAIKAGQVLPDDSEENELNADESKALGRIDERVGNLEKAMADMHPEVPQGVSRLEQRLAAIEVKVDQLLGKIKP